MKRLAIVSGIVLLAALLFFTNTAQKPSVAFGAQYQSENSSIGATSGSVAVTAPTGIQVGDLLVGMSMIYSGGVPDCPSTWTPITSTNNGLDTISCYKIADSGDAAAGSFTFTYPAGTQVRGAGVMRFNDVDTTTPVSGAVTNFMPNGDGVCAPTDVTTTDSNDLVMVLGFSQEEGTWAFTIANASLVSEHIDVQTTAGADMSIAAASGPLTSVGGSGTITGTRSNNVDEGACHAFVIEGAAAPAPAPVASDIIMFE